MQLIGTFQIILLVIATAINIVLAILVYQNNSRSATNIIYGILSLLLSVWLFMLYFSNHPSFSLSSLFWTRMAIFIAAPMSVSFFLLAYILPHESFQFLKNKSFIFLLTGTAIVMLINISPYAFTGMEMSNNVERPTPGVGIIPFGILSTLSSIAAIYILMRKWRHSSGLEKGQYQYILLGILLMLGLIIFTIFVPTVFLKNDFFVSFAPLYTLIFLGMTAYSIVRHNLFNVKVLATQALVIVIWVVLFSKIVVTASPTETIIDSFILIATVIFGILLMRSVVREVEQREKLQVLSDELARANEELKKLDQAKSEFISIASHQLRTPLTVVRGYVSMALEGSLGKLSIAGKDAFLKVAFEVDQLVKLIGSLLNLSRIEAGKIKYEYSEGDFTALVKGIVSELQPAALKKNVTLTFDNQGPESLMMVFDPDKMREVVVNLTDNAIKYSKDGQVHVTEKLAKDVVRLEVKDTGIGIKKEDISHLFGKFARTDEAQKADPGGMGIGLYFVKRVVEDHHGKVWVESEGLGKGSLFIVELPTMQVK